MKPSEMTQSTLDVAQLQGVIDRLKTENAELQTALQELRNRGVEARARNHDADIQRLKAEAMEARAYAEVMGETVRDAVLVLDAQLRVRAANRAFFQNFSSSWEDTVGRPLSQLANGQWEIPELIDLLTKILEGQADARELHFEHEFPALGLRRLEISHVRLNDGSENSTLLVIEDATERTRTQDSLRSSEARLRALVSSMDDVVFEVDEHGSCLTAWTGNRQLLARSREDRHVHSIEDFLPAHSAGPVRDAFERVIRTNRPESVEYSLELNGERRWFQARINRIASREGVQKTLSILVREITARKGAEIALLQSEERFRLLVEGVKDYAIFALDSEGRVVSWNRGAERIKGYTPQEIIGKHFSVFYPPEEVAAGRPAQDLQIAAAEGQFEDIEGWRVRKDGSRFCANLVINAIRDKNGALLGFTKITRDITDRKRAEDAVRQLSGHILRLQDEERRRIARELHDSTAQVLTALSMNLSLAGKRPGVAGDAQAARLITESELLANQASDEIRNISHLLHPPDLDAVGLLAAIRWYAARFGERTGIAVKLNLPNDLCRLPQANELALFRVVQESLTNVQRHSGSNVVRIHITQRDHIVELAIEDKGRGIPAEVLGQEPQSVQRLGVGIAGMRERVKQLGGSLHIVSSPRGTKVKAVVPCPPQPSSNRTVG